MAESLRSQLQRSLAEGRGVLFAEPNLVYRNTYTGRGLLGKNQRLGEGDADDRGYVPVEWWIMSAAEADNPVPRAGEGISKLRLAASVAGLDELGTAAGDLLFGSAQTRWPLIKLLDIGGPRVRGDFSDRDETPPIPPHVHSGAIVDGKAQGPGKLEAYFFPPVAQPDLAQELQGTITRLGLRPDVTLQQFEQALSEFGQGDAMYSLLQEYPIRPYDGWTIPPKVVHAPGPWPTLEVQLPQDDFNLAGWHLGKRIASEQLDAERESLCLRGLHRPADFAAELVNWPVSAASDFRERHYRAAEVVEESQGARRLRIFFDPFHGEAWEVEPSASLQVGERDEPYCAFVWDGQGELDAGRSVDTQINREFLVTPDTPVSVLNTGSGTLTVFTVGAMSAS